MGCGTKMVGMLLIVFNILLFLFGLALGSIGVWSVVDKVYVADVIGDDLFSAASYMFIFSGVFLLTVAVLGICAVCRESRRFTVIYFILLSVIFVVLLLTAILAVVFKGELEDEMTDAMRSSLLSGYGKDSSVTDSWDRLQADVTRQDSWLLFERTPWYQDARVMNIEPIELVPRSCCVYDEKIGDYIDLRKCQTWQLGPPGNLKMAINNNALHYDGCYEKARGFVSDQADILLACSFTFAFCMLGGLVLTFMLYRLLGQRNRVIRD